MVFLLEISCTAFVFESKIFFLDAIQNLVENVLKLELMDSKVFLFQQELEISNDPEDLDFFVEAD